MTTNNQSVLNKKRQLLNYVLGAVILLISICYIPFYWCCREADSYFNGDKDKQLRMAHTAEAWVSQNLTSEYFSTGSSRYNGEWHLMTYQLAGIGFGQTAFEHRELSKKHKILLDSCCLHLLQKDMMQFDTDAWHVNAFDSLKTSQGHMGYLGYTNVLLSYYRYYCKTFHETPNPDIVTANDRITATLVRRLSTSKIKLLETYPNETYPIDNCTAFASIALYEKATGKHYGSLLHQCIDKLKTQYRNPKTGMLYQNVDSETGDPYDQSRASGTLLASYYLSFVDPELSRELYFAVKKNQVKELVGFAAIREYPADTQSMGDVDSGPVIFGLSPSATAFAYAGARIHNDRSTFKHLFSTLYLVGSPVDHSQKTTFLIGGPLGDSLMFALLTAQKPEVYQ